MKHTVILIATLFMVITSHAITRRALVIGIGSYPAESGWKQINGDKDIPLVEEILMVNGFSTQNIVELKNEQATCAAICRELENLITQSQNGDYVYIHFSGHGQQITDLNGDEEDGYDESWIPYDAKQSYIKGSYEGQNHLIDDQLNHYLHSLRQRVGVEGKIIVIADACHSGGSSRADEDEDEEYVIRGTLDNFVIPNPKKGTPITLFPIQWTIISACTDKQSNQEYKGKGSLTYALYLQRTNFSKFTASRIIDEVEGCFISILPRKQTPVLELTAGNDLDMFL